jgi:hypothetical protein
MADSLHWQFPVVLDSSGHPRTVVQDTLDHVRDQVNVALITRPEQGTPLRPGWGTPDPNFHELPLDLDELTDTVTDLIPAAQLHADQVPDLVAEGLLALNVYVSTGG